VTRADGTLVVPARQEAHRYEVVVGGGVLDALARLCAGRDAVALVSCRRVLATPHGARVARALRPTLVHALPDGERGKTLAELERAAGRLLSAGATRRSLVVALGGGAVTDAAGFLAATFMRGVDWVAVPTTLLAMVDAAIGGKTAVNLPVAKNAVGAFHPPLAVLADLRALETLPPRELGSGMGEVVKYACLEPALLPAVSAGRVDAALVARCAGYKTGVVERDPKERGERKLLNLGHTFGHGVEAAGRFEAYTHGEAVAVGLAFAFRLARRLGRLGDDAVDAADELLDGAGLPRAVPAAVARRAADLMAFDKKRTAAGLRWVLPRASRRGWKVEWDVAAEARAVAATVEEIAGGGARRAARPQRRRS
jgi:3-dehydroquinate synthetase